MSASRPGARSWATKRPRRNDRCGCKSGEQEGKDSLVLLSTLKEIAMKKALLTALALALLYGCASQPVEPEKPSVAPAPSRAPVTTPASSSIPSKRSIFYDYDKSDIKD